MISSRGEAAKMIKRVICFFVGHIDVLMPYLDFVCLRCGHNERETFSTRVAMSGWDR